MEFIREVKGTVGNGVEEVTLFTYSDFSSVAYVQKGSNTIFVTSDFVDEGTNVDDGIEVSARIVWTKPINSVEDFKEAIDYHADPKNFEKLEAIG